MPDLMYLETIWKPFETCSDGSLSIQHDDIVHIDTRDATHKLLSVIGNRETYYIHSNNSSQHQSTIKQIVHTVCTETHSFISVNLLQLTLYVSPHSFEFFSVIFSLRFSKRLFQVIKR